LTLKDWTTWSNCIWVQDFALKNKDTEFSETHVNFKFNQDFKETLQDFVSSIIPQDLRYQEVLGFDLDNYEFKDINVILSLNMSNQK